jgi:hypothetical protein
LNIGQGIEEAKENSLKALKMLETINSQTENILTDFFVQEPITSISILAM